MTRKKLTEDDVARIRGSGNPQRAYAPGFTHGDLVGKSYLQIVEIFSKRINEWYFDTAEAFATKVENYNFPTIIFCCVIIDLLSQYIYGSPAQKEKNFTDFFEKYLYAHYKNLQKPILSCRFYNDNWHEEKIEDIPSAFYHCFRSGVVHSGRILEYGRINEIYPKEIFKCKEWESGKYELWVHTTGLLSELRKIFDQYIEDLKSKSSKHKSNFIKKFKIEYGVDLE